MQKDDKQKELEIISKENIKHFVQELIKDDNINIKALPDYFEKNIYISVLTILMQIIKHSMEDLNIEFMGHRIKISMEPIEKNNGNQNNEKKQ